jgi:hypothetical protein
MQRYANAVLILSGTIHFSCPLSCLSESIDHQPTSRRLYRGKQGKFIDVCDLQRQLKANGATLQVEADESTTGPARFVAVDRDGNTIFVDQHV